MAGARDRDNALPPENENVNEIIRGSSAIAPHVPGAPRAARPEREHEGAIETHPSYDAYWQLRTAAVRKITVPTLLTVSWQDEQVGSGVAEAIRDFSPSTEVRLVGTNGDHEEYFRVEPGSSSVSSSVSIWTEHCPAATVAAYRRRGPVTILLETDRRGYPRTEFSESRLALGGPGATYRLGSNLRPDRGDAASSSSVFTERPEGAPWYQQDDGEATFTLALLRTT